MQPDAEADVASNRLAGLSALVTGAGGGIGGAIAERFVAEGARVIGLDVSGEGNGFPLSSCDVRDAEAVERSVLDAAARNDGLDIVVTAAALTGGRAAFPEVTDDEWQSYLDVNLTGTFRTCRAAARLMLAQGRGGSVITVGSVNSLSAEREALPYVASKGAVALLTRAMAVDLAPHGIRANMLAPGPVEVPRNQALFRSPAFRRGLRRTVPLGHAAEPTDVANAAIYLAEPASRMVTGTTLLVDGGLLAQIPPFDLDAD
jgi:NAD(P)-dependent dehydrogenase (short-subunit alcohol dehydrogenase family)